MKQVAAPTGVFVLLLAIYLWTMAPGIFWIDSAAFTACNEILGLPHSPSFPVYTAMGRTSHALLPLDPATASNLFSALTAAAGGAVFYLIFHLLMQPLSLSERIKVIASSTGALFAFLTVPVWQSAVRAEVYSLQVLLSLLVIYLFLKSVGEKHLSGKLRWALAAVFFQGLSFANHSLLAIVTLPLVLSLPFLSGFRIMTSAHIRFMAAAVVLFCVALSFYLYLPIRSRQDPAINSGQPKTLALTLKVITRSGEDYIPSGIAAKPDYIYRTGKLAGFIFEQTGGLIILGIITGLFVAGRKKNIILLLIAGLIPWGLALTVWAADFKLLNYDIVAYSALPLALIILTAFYGLCHLAEKTSRKTAIARLVPAIFVLMVFFQLTGNLYACDLSGTAGPDRLAQIILEEAPPQAILMLNEDNVVLPLWYHCLALNRRPDLAVISTGGLYRPSYRDELRILYPYLKFPKEFKDRKIENFSRAVKSFCDLNGSDRPIMIQFGIPGIDPARLVPGGFLFHYQTSDQALNTQAKFPMTELLDYIADGATDLLTREFVARTAFNYGVYFDRMGRTETAFGFFRYAIETDDENPDYLFRLGIAFLNAGRQDEAVLLLQEAVKTGDGCPEAEKLLRQIKDREFGQR